MGNLDLWGLGAALRVAGVFLAASYYTCTSTATRKSPSRPSKVTKTTNCRIDENREADNQTFGTPMALPLSAERHPNYWSGAWT